MHSCTSTSLVWCRENLSNISSWKWERRTGTEAGTWGPVSPPPASRQHSSWLSWISFVFLHQFPGSSSKVHILTLHFLSHLKGSEYLSGAPKNHQLVRFCTKIQNHCLKIINGWLMPSYLVFVGWPSGTKSLRLRLLHRDPYLQLEQDPRIFWKVAILRPFVQFCLYLFYIYNYLKLTH